MSAHPRWWLSSRTRPCLTPTSGCSSVTAASPIAGTDAPMRLPDSRRLASSWFGLELGMRRGSSTEGPSWVPPRPCDHAAEVPAVLPVHVLAVPQIQFTIRVPDIPVVCKAGYVVAQKTVGFSPAQFLVLLSRYAWFGSGYLFCVSTGVLLDVYSTCWWYSAPEVDSVLLSCLWPRSSSTTAVVCASWFLVAVHLALCSLRLLQAWERRSRAVDASVANFA